MSPPKVQVIVLQYNNSQDTVKCLESLQHLDYPNFRVLVIDNGSEKKEADIIEKFVSRLPITSYQLLATNLGYSGGNNFGIKYALQNSADYVLILNNDTTATRDFLTEMVTMGESNSKIGILGPAIDEGNRTVYGGKISWLKPELKHITNYQSPATPDSLRESRILDSAKRNRDSYQLPVTYLPGSSLLIKHEVIEQIGFFDERYFLYFEDADYCLRASRAGYRLKIVPEAVVHHQVSSSTSKLGSALLLRYHFRNAHLFNRKHGPWWVQILLPIWSFWVIIKQTVKIVFMPARRKVSVVIIKGVVDFYRGRFGVIK